MSGEFFDSLVEDAELVGRPTLSPDLFPVWGDGVDYRRCANLDEYDDDPEWEED